MMELEANEILGFAIDRATEINVFWNIYLAVITAIFAIMASGKTFTNNRILKTLLSAVFIVFAYSNLEAILTLGELRSALLELLSTDLGLQKVVENLRPHTRWEYTRFHVFIDIAVLASIWFVPWQKIREQTKG